MSEPVLPAPLWRRLVAALYDIFLLLGLWLGATLIVMLMAHLAGLKPGVGFTRALLFLLSFGFFGWFWTHGGQTLGMRAWRLRVRRTDGSALNWPAAMTRFALSISLGISVLWCWLDSSRRAWHDRLSGTEVVLLPKAIRSADAAQPP